MSAGSGSGSVGVSEGGAEVSYTVVLDTEPSATVTVTPTSGDPDVVTVTPTSLTFTTGNWATAQTVTVTAVDDNDADDESVEVTHTATSSDDDVYNNLAGDMVTVTVDDDEVPVVAVSFGSDMYTVSEGGLVSVSVGLGSALASNMTIRVAAEGRGGAAPSDFTAGPTSLVFTPDNWDTEQTVTVTAADDRVDDDGESVLLRFASLPAGISAGDPATATVTIVDNDTAGVSVVPDMSLDSPVGEGSTGTYTVVLDSEPSQNVTVTAASDDTGAVTVTPTVLTFTTGDWSTAQTVTVTAVDDANADDETVAVTHTAASSDSTYDNLAGTPVEVRVTDNETAGVTIAPGSLPSPVGEGGTGTYTVVLDSEPSQNVTVTAASDDTGAVTVTPTVLTFTTGNWAAAQTVTVTAVQDDNADDETVAVTHTAASSDSTYDNLAGTPVEVRVTDNEVAGVSVVPDMGLSPSVHEGSTGTYTVVLDSEPSANVTVTATSGNESAVTVTPTVLTFTTGNWATARTVTVTAVDDADANDETVTVTHTVTSSSDAVYNAVTAAGLRVEVDDNDDAGVSVVPDMGLRVDEGGATGSYTVVLDSQPSENVTVTAASVDAGAVTVTSPMSLTFTTGNWATAQTVTVRAVDDADADDESVEVTHTAASSDTTYNNLVGTPVEVRVTDDEVAGVTAGSGPVGVTEGGATGSYTVVLDSQPSQNVTVTATSLDAGAVTVTPTTLTFTTGNWATAQTVTVRAVDDANADDESVEVTHTAASSDTAYNNLVGTPVEVRVTDDEVAGVTVGSGPVGVTEGGATGSYTVVLDSEPSQNVTVTATSLDAGAVTVTPTTLTFTTGNWATAQTVTVRAVDDANADNESVTVTHTAASADTTYNNLVGTPVEVRVTDDEVAGVTAGSGPVGVTEGGADRFVHGGARQ